MRERKKKKPLGHFPGRRVAVDGNRVGSIRWQVKPGGWGTDFENSGIFLIKAALVQPKAIPRLCSRGQGTSPFTTGGVCRGVRARPGPYLFGLLQEELAKCPVTAAALLGRFFQFVWQLASWPCLSSFPSVGSVDPPRQNGV